MSILLGQSPQSVLTGTVIWGNKRWGHNAISSVYQTTAATIDYIIIKAKRVGISGNVTIEIWDTPYTDFAEISGLDDGDAINIGDLIGSKTIDSSGWNDSAYDSHTFTFDAPIELPDQGIFIISIKHPGGGLNNCIEWAFPSGFSYTQIKSTDGGSSWTKETGAIGIFQTWGTEREAPAQPTSPSPGHEDTGVEFPTTPLSYTASDDPSADTYDIYFGIKDSVLVKIAETEDVTSWRMPYNILNIKDYNPATLSGYRSPIAGDVIYDDADSYTIKYVVRGDLINVQYQAKLYAFRTTGPGGKNPGDVLTNGVAPDVGDPQAVRVTLNDQLFFHGVVEEIYLPPNTTFEWRVDATNEAGTTTGNTWEFTTQALKIPKVSYVLISGGSGAGPYDYPPGEEGTDWNWTGKNNMMAIRRLIAAANNKIWVEDI